MNSWGVMKLRVVQYCHQLSKGNLGLPRHGPSVALCPSCPSHPSVPKGCMDSERTSHGVPSVTLCPRCPSHPTVPKGCTDSERTSHGVPSVALCPSCPSHPSVPKGCTDSERTSHGVPYYRPLSQLSIPSLSPSGMYGQ